MDFPESATITNAGTPARGNHETSMAGEINPDMSEIKDALGPSGHSVSLRCDNERSAISTGSNSE